MSRTHRIVNDLYCRLSCYTSVTYKNMINTCHCHPTCKQLNTYKTKEKVVKNFQYPNAFNVGKNNNVCDCRVRCKHTLTEL